MTTPPLKPQAHGATEDVEELVDQAFVKTRR
jgi:hypothetical protein